MHRFVQSFFVGALCVLGNALPLHAQMNRPAHLPPRTSVTRAIDSLVQEFVQGGAAPGVSVAVVRERDTLALRGWGFANIETSTPMSRSSVVAYASLTKQFVSAAVLQLVADGRVRLEERIERYVSDLPLAWRSVTVEQFLNHTAGVPNFVVPDTAWERHFAEPMTPRQILAQVANTPTRFAPGTSWEYTGTGYVVLGLLIESVTGRPWETDLEERFLKPLGLRSVRSCRLAPVIPNRAGGYERARGEWLNMRPLEVTQRFTAGALCGTAEDMLRWNDALHHGRLLPDSLYRRMTTPAGAATRTGYGFGLSAARNDGVTMYFHGGSNHGYGTWSAWIPSAQLSIVVLANGGFAPAAKLGQQIARAVLGASLLAPAR